MSTITNPGRLSLDEMLAERAAIADQAEAILTRSDGQTLSGTEAEAFAALEERIENLNRYITVARAASRPGAIQPGTFTPEAFSTNTRTAPFDTDRLHGMDPERRTAEVRAMARDAIEAHTHDEHVSDDAKENITRSLERDDDASRYLAELITATGSAEYRRAFLDRLRDPAAVSPRIVLERAKADLEQRASLNLSGTQGALFPYALDATIVLTNASTISPIRSVANVVQIAGTNEWRSPQSAGVTAEVLSEAQEFSDATPTFSSTAIFAHKAGAYIQGSWESLSDSQLGSQLGMLMMDAKNRLEAQLLVTGTGVGQPQGIVTFASNTTSVVAGSSGAANSSELVANDLYGLTEALNPRWRDNSVFLGNLAIANAIRKLGTSTTSHAYTLDLTQAGPPTLLGKRFLEVSDMDSTIQSGSTDMVLIYGDVSTYAIVDRIGATLVDHQVTGASGRLTGVQGFAMYWRFGAGGLVQPALKMLKL